MTLRVLHVIPSFASGGSERQLILLAAALVRAGVSVHIAHLHEGPHLAAAAQCGAELHRLTVAGNHDPTVIARLFTLIRRLQPAVVQTWLLHADVFGGSAAKLSRVPWVLAERCSSAMYAAGAKNRLRRVLGSTATAIVANSEAGLGYWRNAGYRGPGTVIRNIVDLHAGESDGAIVRDADAGSPLILAVGRLTEQKNWPTTLRALEILFEALPRASAVVLGEGPLRDQLQQRISRSAVLAGRVRLAGFVHDVAHWYRQASAFVSLSHYEGTPNTVLEALLYGCPVVVSDIPEHREIVTADTAWLVDRSDAPSAAAALAAVLADSAHAAAVAARARQALTQWSPGAIAAAYIDLYGKLWKDYVACVY